MREIYLYKMTKSMFNNAFRFIRNVLSNKNQNNNNNVMMGRWNLEYNSAIQNRKVYWANMDHCGCCETNSFHTVNKTEKSTKKEQSKQYEKSEEYLLPYVM